MVNTRHYTFVPTHRMYNTENEPNVDCRLIEDNKCSMLRPDFSSRGMGWESGGEGRRGTNPKTALQRRSVK